MQHAFQLIDHAERVIQGEQLQISGKIKLSVPTTYGHYRLPPLLEKFLCNIRTFKLKSVFLIETLI